MHPAESIIRLVIAAGIGLASARVTDSVPGLSDGPATQRGLSWIDRHW
jgi:hypothetical protein